MPGARTYQAIGFATYQGGRLYARRHRAELRRAAVKGATLVALAGLVAALLASALRRAGGQPTI